MPGCRESFDPQSDDRIDPRNAPRGHGRGHDAGDREPGEETHDEHVDSCCCSRYNACAPASATA